MFCLCYPSICKHPSGWWLKIVSLPGSPYIQILKKKKNELFYSYFDDGTNAKKTKKNSGDNFTFFLPEKKLEGI